MVYDHWKKFCIDKSAQKCYNQFDVIYKKEKLGNVDTLFLYTYNDFIHFFTPQ